MAILPKTPYELLDTDQLAGHRLPPDLEAVGAGDAEQVDGVTKERHRWGGREA